MPAERRVTGTPSVRRTLDGERLIAVFSRIVEPLGQSLPASSEVVLHDLSLLPNSIVAVYGDVTGRRVGDPTTDLLLEQAVTGFSDAIGYETRLPDGRKMRSSTMIIRDVLGNPVAAMCINTDISAWLSVMSIAQGFLGRGPDVSAPLAELVDTAAPASAPPGPSSITAPTRPAVEASGTGGTGGTGEAFARNVDELAAFLVHQAVSGIGVPVSAMKKEQKVEIVRDLKDRGMFLLRDAVEMVAEALDVTRFTIYNYLNELSAEEPVTDAAAPRKRKRGERSA